MIIPAVESPQLTPGQIRQILRQVYPLRGRFSGMSTGQPVALWYPWYFCAANIRMDTYLKSGIQASDLVAVDGVRPMRERINRIPACETISADDAMVVPLRTTADMAAAEARELLQVIILNRNKLLKTHQIEMKTPELRYIRMWIIPLNGQMAPQWLVHDPHFGGSYALSRRREILEIIGQLIPQTH